MLDIKLAKWDINEIKNLDNLAMTYDFLERPCGHYQVNEYPACQLRISLNDLNKILLIFTSNDEKILKNESIKMMLPNDCEFGLIWWGKNTSYGTFGCWSHGLGCFVLFLILILFRWQIGRAHV